MHKGTAQMWDPKQDFRDTTLSSKWKDAFHKTGCLVLLLVLVLGRGKCRTILESAENFNIKTKLNIHPNMH